MPLMLEEPKHYRAVLCELYKLITEWIHHHKQTPDAHHNRLLGLNRPSVPLSLLSISPSEHKIHHWAFYSPSDLEFRNQHRVEALLHKTTTCL